MKFVLTKDNCRFWYDDIRYMVMFLSAQQTYFNDYYKANDRLSLDQVLATLGIKVPAEFPFLGWVYNHNSDPYIDFGISEIYAKTSQSWAVKEHKRYCSNGSIITVKAHIKHRKKTPKKVVLYINCPEKPWYEEK